MIVQGLTSLAYHLAAVGVAWVFAMVIIAVLKYHTLKVRNLLMTNEDNAGRKAVEDTAAICRIVATAAATIFALTLAFFVYNPAERPPNEIITIPKALVDENYVPPTKEEIAESNEERVNAQHESREKEAEEDNTKAMGEAIDLFREAAK